jgi:hypothetical protein
MVVIKYSVKLRVFTTAIVLVRVECVFILCHGTLSKNTCLYVQFGFGVPKLMYTVQVNMPNFDCFVINVFWREGVNN